MNIVSSIQMICIAAIPLIFAITLHEAAHGWIASKCGDNTAQMLGRVTLNPIKHIDLLGTIILPILMLLFSGFIFGWAKPVPVNWRNLHHRRRDMALVAIAGPAANFLMALLWAIIAKLNYLFLGKLPSQSFFTSPALFIHLTATFGILINCVLMVLNLIPIPPLDGSRVVASLLPPKLVVLYGKIEPFGIWILLLLLVFGVLGYVLWPPITYLINQIKFLFSLPSIGPF